jgi:hypothetical protein
VFGVGTLKYTKEMLADAVSKSVSMAGVQRALGLRITGGSHAHLRRRINYFGIDTSHFLGMGHNRGKLGRRRPPAERLIALPPDAKRIPGWRLLAGLRAIGRPETCEGCGLGPHWNGVVLRLHVDHISGDYLDNRPSNLRLMCPNCHSQTPTYAGRGKVGHNGGAQAGVAEWQTRGS